MSNCHTYRGQETHLRKQTKAQLLFCSLTPFLPQERKKPDLPLNEDVCHITAMEFAFGNCKYI